MSPLLFCHIEPLVAARLYNSNHPFFQFQEKQHNKALIFWAFLLPIALLIALISVRLVRNHEEKKHYNRQNLAPYDYSFAIKQLSNFTFVPVAEGPEFRQELNQIKVIDDANVSPSEEDALKDSLDDLIMAFHVGTYEAYRKFRTPIQAIFNDKVVNYHKTILQRFYKRPGEALPNDQESIVRLIWERDFGGNAFSNYWEGIGIESASITYEDLDKMPADLADVAAGQINLGLFEIPSTFTFTDDPQTLLMQNGKVLFATIYFVFKPAPPDPPTPLRVRYYWDPTDKAWLPLQMVSSNAHKRTRDPFF